MTITQGVVVAYILEQGARLVGSGRGHTVVSLMCMLIRMQRYLMRMQDHLLAYMKQSFSVLCVNAIAMCYIQMKKSFKRMRQGHSIQFLLHDMLETSWTMCFVFRLARVHISITRIIHWRVGEMPVHMEKAECSLFGNYDCTCVAEFVGTDVVSPMAQPRWASDYRSWVCPWARSSSTVMAQDACPVGIDVSQQGSRSLARTSSSRSWRSRAGRRWRRLTVGRSSWFP